MEPSLPTHRDDTPNPPRKRVAVVGAGGAGVVSAWLLDGHCDVVLYEAADRLGGHAHTVELDVGGRRLPVEVGAEFCFEWAYRGLLALIDRLGLPRRTHPIACSISLADGRVLTLPPLTAAAVAGCLSPRSWRRLYWMRALASAGEALIAAPDRALTVGAWIERVGVATDVATTLVLPLVAASWGVEVAAARELSAVSVVNVTGMRTRYTPRGVVVAGGLGAYVRGLVADTTTVDLRLGAPVDGLELDDGAVQICAGGRRERFDAAVLACDWRTSARLCLADDRIEGWHRAFAAVEDYPTHVAVHLDPGFLPARRGLWGSANFDLSGRPRNTVWSGQRHRVDVFRTWLRPDEAPPTSTLVEARYRHVLTTPAHAHHQARIAALQGDAGIWAAGMYTTGVDNHESAVRSAVSVAEALAPDGERLRWLRAHVVGHLDAPPAAGALSAPDAPAGPRPRTPATASARPPPAA